jgi:hypothetical protein
MELQTWPCPSHSPQLAMLGPSDCGAAFGGTWGQRKEVRHFGETEQGSPCRKSPWTARLPRVRPVPR